ncbi:hypothetical protein RIF29_37452 [Crotalaria pallida]|uniref:Uncharacterized protein n=1 Tax=Crotalaria pallida TaxID=3830 RepID=A0AAN9EEE5_CROPI
MERGGWVEVLLIHQLIRIGWEKIGPPHLNISTHPQSLIRGTFYTNPGASILSFFLPLSLLFFFFLFCVRNRTGVTDYRYFRTEQKTLLVFEKKIPARELIVRHNGPPTHF